MKKVLMAVDATGGAKALLSVYKALVRQPECVVLIHVQPLKAATAQKEPQDVNSGQILGAFRQELKARGQVEVRTLVREGIPSEQILKAAHDECVDLIIMGRAGRNGLRGLFARCTAKEVERATAVPVVVAKTAGGKKSNTDHWREAYAA